MTIPPAAFRDQRPRWLRPRPKADTQWFTNARSAVGLWPQPLICYPTFKTNHPFGRPPNGLSRPKTSLRQRLRLASNCVRPHFSSIPSSGWSQKSSKISRADYIVLTAKPEWDSILGWGAKTVEAVRPKLIQPLALMWQKSFFGQRIGSCSHLSVSLLWCERPYFPQHGSLFFPNHLIFSFLKKCYWSWPILKAISPSP